MSYVRQADRGPQSCGPRGAPRRTIPEATATSAIYAPTMETMSDPMTAAVQRACELLETREGASLGLDALGRAVGVSADHLQRAFKARTGVTPREYAESLRVQRLKTELRDTPGDVAGAAFAAGYGSVSTAYAAADQHLGMTPASYGAGGRGAALSWTVVDSAFGALLVSATDRGVASVALGPDETSLEAALAAEFPHAVRTRDDDGLAGVAAQVAAHVGGTGDASHLPLDVRATAFQWRVWRALRAIPRGETRTYTQLAEAIGSPSAVRAVARACATNPVAVVTPCHRVVRADGTLAGFRWGVERKAALLAGERRHAAAA